MLKHILFSLTLAAAAAPVFAQQAPPPAGKPFVHVQAAVLASAQKQTRGGIRTLTPPAAASITTSVHRTIIENLEDVGGYASFVQSVERAALVPKLQMPGTYTVFVPGDAAFAKLPPGQLAGLWQPANRTALQARMAAHVIPVALREADLTDGRVLTTLAGTTLRVSRAGGRLALIDATGLRAEVTLTDLAASNGTMHVLYQVLNK